MTKAWFTGLSLRVKRAAKARMMVCRGGMGRMIRPGPAEASWMAQPSQRPAVALTLRWETLVALGSQRRAICSRVA